MTQQKCKCGNTTFTLHMDNEDKHCIFCNECTLQFFWPKKEWDDSICPLRKYKGRKWSMVPTDYLQWCEKNFDHGQMKDRVIEELETRRLAGQIQEPIKKEDQPRPKPVTQHQEEDLNDSIPF